MSAPPRRREIFARVRDSAGGRPGHGPVAAAQRLRRALALTTALVALGLAGAPMTAGAARAQSGGNGAPDAAGNPGGAGGGFGVAGSPGTGNSGGGGGGAGGEPGGLGAGTGGTGGAGGTNGNGAGTATLDNSGALTGGDGATGGQAIFGGSGGGGAGGYGAVVTGSGNNSGTITGGNGGMGDLVGSNGGIGSKGGDGGDGALFVGSGAIFTNSNQVTGGDGNAGGGSALYGGNPSASSFSGSGGAGGDGGTGVSFMGLGAAFVNSGTVQGGTGGTGGEGGNEGLGAGSGAIGGNGGAGGAGGDGVSFASPGGVFLNSNVVMGGKGGDGAASANVGTGSPVSPNTGMISGNGGDGGNGGNGVTFSGAGGAFANLGTVTAGNGGDGGNADNAGNGGYGPNSGAISGNGGNGGSGGNGVVFAGSGGAFVNLITVTGGDGGAGGAGGNAGTPRGGVNSGNVSGNGGNGGIGGAGVVFAGQAGTFDNSGAVTGGNGGRGGAPENSGSDGGPSTGTVSGNGGNGADGGAGVVLAGRGATFTNSGTVTGGVGGSSGAGEGGGSNGTAGAGGVGVIADQATIVNQNLIQGGRGGVGGGAGGIGIVGANLVVDNTGGTIAGGFASGAPFVLAIGVIRAPLLLGPEAYAIELTGGRNYVGGAGTINGGIDVAGGSFQPALPGSPVGTPLAVNGPLVFAHTATYSIRIAGRANDSTVVSPNTPVRATPTPGTATLNGAKVVVGTPGAPPVRGMRYAIVTAADGVVGRFRPDVGSDLAFFAPTLSYDPTHVYLNSTYNFARPGLTWNERNVGQGLNNAAGLGQSAQGNQVLTALEKVPTGQGRAVLDSLSGEGLTAAQNVAYRSSQLFTSSIFDQTTFYANNTANSVTLTEPLPGFVALAARQGQPIRELADLPASRVEPTPPPPPPTRTWRAWATGWGGEEHISGNAFPIGSASQNSSIYGGTLGVDYQLTPNYLLGVAVGGSNGIFQVDQRGTSGTTTGGHIAIYDLYELGPWYGASSTAFSYFGNKTTRFVTGFGGLASETERGNFASGEFRTRFEFGRHFTSLPAFAGLPALAGFGTVTPFLALEIAELRSNGFTETALNGPGLFRLNVNGQSAASVPGSIGLRFQRITPLGNGMVLSPTLQLAYLHEFAPYRSELGQIASLPGSTFLVDGARPARDSAQVKAGAELALGPHSALFANFEGEFSGVDQLYAGKGGFRYVW